jgi:hypothetical protein
MNKITVTKTGSKWVARFAFDFATKDHVKAAGFRFDPDTKSWWTADASIAARIDPDAAEAVNRAIEASRAVSATCVAPPRGSPTCPIRWRGSPMRPAGPPPDR